MGTDGAISILIAQFATFRVSLAISCVFLDLESKNWVVYKQKDEKRNDILGQEAIVSSGIIRGRMEHFSIVYLKELTCNLLHC